MIDLFLLLFILQGNNPIEWADSCFYDFNDTMISENTRDVYFCKALSDLNLSYSDVVKLGKELDWDNYLIQTANEFVGKWEYYQKIGIKDTLYIYPSISNREVVPPEMTAVIGFDYKLDNKIKRFEKTFIVSPLNHNRICNDDVENYRCIVEQNPYFFDESLRMAKDKVFIIEESNAAGSGTSNISIYNFQTEIIIVGILIGVGSFLGLMIFWSKKKIKN